MSWYKEFTVEPVENPQPKKGGDTKRKNLLLGLPIYGISVNGTLLETHQTEYFNTPDTVNSLTNGKHPAKAIYNEPGFFHFSTGVGRTIMFKLPYLSAVDSLNISFLRQDDVAVRLPRKLDILLSVNGKDWQIVNKTRAIGSKKDNSIVNVCCDFKGIYKALYVAVKVEVVSHVWLDEIELYGTEAMPENAKDIVADDEQSSAALDMVNKYPEIEDFLGIHNVLLSYNCVTPEKVGENHSGYADEEQYLPYVGYVKDGKIVDTMFDAFLFLPYSVYTYSSLYKCASGWNYYIDNVFAKGYNLDALDKTAAKVGKALGKDDYKVTVFFSILHTNVTYGSHPDKFGDLDGDGVDENMQTLRDRKKAIKWCIDTQIAKYKEMNPRHCELKGFYWFEENINYSDKYETKLLEFAKKYLHSLGLKIFWIPYFQAWGFQDWKDNGFDIACMQPNYAFNKAVPVERLYDNARITKQLGMCVEMEIGGFTPYDVEKFRNYMDCGAETGYMNSVKMYYQGGVPGEFYKAYKSEDPLMHALYDETYLYAKEKYVSRKNR